MVFKLDTLKKMIRNVISTRLDEIGCDDCFEQLNHFAELVLAGQPAAALMPLVQDHLDRCMDCREEYETLLRALKASAA